MMNLSEKTVCVFIPFSELSHAENLAALEEVGSVVVMPDEEPDRSIARVICSIDVACHLRDSLLTQAEACRQNGEGEKANAIYRIIKATHQQIKNSEAQVDADCE